MELSYKATTLRCPCKTRVKPRHRQFTDLPGISTNKKYNPAAWRANRRCWVLAFLFWASWTKWCNTATRVLGERLFSTRRGQMLWNKRTSWQQAHVRSFWGQARETHPVMREASCVLRGKALLVELPISMSGLTKIRCCYASELVGLPSQPCHLGIWFTLSPILFWNFTGVRNRGDGWAAPQGGPRVLIY